MGVLVGNVWMDGCAARHLVAEFSDSCAPGPGAVDFIDAGRGFLAPRSGKRAIDQTCMAQTLAPGVAHNVFKSAIDQLLSLLNLYGPALRAEQQLVFCTGPSLVPLHAIRLRDDASLRAARVNSRTRAKSCFKSPDRRATDLLRSWRLLLAQNDHVSLLPDNYFKRDAVNVPTVA